MLEPEAFKEVTARIAEFAKEIGADLVIGPESRGFLLAFQPQLKQIFHLLQYANPENFQEKPFLSPLPLNTGLIL